MTETMDNCFHHTSIAPTGNTSLQSKDLVSSLPVLNKGDTVFASSLWSQPNSSALKDLPSSNSAFNSHSLPLMCAVPKDIQISQNINNVLLSPPPSAPVPQGVQLESSFKTSNFRLPFTSKRSGPTRLNKFVRRLHDMLQSEQESGIVEWRKGLLVLHSTDTFTKKILPKYFNTTNFKTFRRQLNYYGFVHVRSFSTTGSTTTALWVNQDLAKRGTKNISSVLMLKRVEPSESAKTAEGRRVRKEEAASTVEDIGISTRAIQLEQIRNLAAKGAAQSTGKDDDQNMSITVPPVPSIVHCSETVTSSNMSTPTLTSSPSCTLGDSSTSIASTETTSSEPITSSDTTTDDAANLLIMLSRSAFSH